MKRQILRILIVLVGLGLGGGSAYALAATHRGTVTHCKPGRCTTTTTTTSSTTTTTTTTPPPPSSYIKSIDTMKLSADHGDLGLTTDYQQALNVMAATNTGYITDDGPLEYPSTIAAWANAIHQAGKHVWFRIVSYNLDTIAHGDSSRASNYQPPYDGYPDYAAGGYLTQWHNIMVSNPTIFQPGDIIDANPEPENSAWWANNYGCGVQSSCTDCPPLGTMTSANYPCRPWAEFNGEMQKAVTQMKTDLAAMGVTACSGGPAATCVWVGAHSTDFGSSQDGPVSLSTVQQAGDVVTVDGYVDSTDPTTNANTYVSSLNNLYNYWHAQDPNVKILLGEWGYNNGQDVSDQNQVDVVSADTTAFGGLSYLIGMNYWVGPGGVGWGGYTYLMRHDTGTWVGRPALSTLSTFYSTK